MEPIRMIDEKIKWHQKKIEILKAFIEAHESEIQRLGGNNEN